MDKQKLLELAGIEAKQEPLTEATLSQSQALNALAEAITRKVTQFATQIASEDAEKGSEEWKRILWSELSAFDDGDTPAYGVFEEACQALEGKVRAKLAQAVKTFETKHGKPRFDDDEFNNG